MVQGTLHWETTNLPTIQKMSFSIKDFSSKCEQIRRKLRIWSHLTEEILNGKLHFLCSVLDWIRYFDWDFHSFPVVKINIFHTYIVEGNGV